MKLVNKIVIGLFFFVLSSCQTEVHRHYYSDGTLKEEYSMRNGKFVGKYKALYERGKPTGTWLYWNEYGELMKTEKY